jgi:hypothetical protein
MKKKLVMFMAIMLIMFSASFLSGQELGDVNQNQVVDIVDALLVAQYYVGLVPATFYTQFADANGNGTVDIVDALLIARYYVGTIKNFPVYDYPVDSKYLVLTVPVIDENT